MIFNKSLIPMKNRTDVISGSEADKFAQIHTAVYNGDKNAIIAFPQSEYILLKTITTNEYYFAKLKEIKSIDGVESKVLVEKIRPEAITLNVAEGQTPDSAVKGQGGFIDVDVISNSTHKPETIYFNSDMIPFKSDEDRKAFESFASEVYSADSTFPQLQSLIEYLPNENFVYAARERIRSNIYQTEFQGTFFENTKLIKHANGALNRAIEQSKSRI